MKTINQEQRIADSYGIEAESKLRKLNNPKTICSALGILANEDGSFLKFKTIDKIIKSLTDEEFYTYATIDGGNDYKNAVLEWVFQEQKQYILDSMYYNVVATSGGTGAISNAIHSTLETQETLMLPNIFWGPYQTMAQINNINILTYDMIVDDKFNINGFKTLADNILEKQGKLTTILNDPCNNPTGYSLTDQELQYIITYMNSQDEYQFHFIYDIAYMDYSLLGIKEVRKKLKILTTANPNITISIAFSGSKTFSIYGMRVGAQIILGKNEKNVNQLFETSCNLARAKWSNISKAGVSMLIKLNANKDLRNSFELEIATTIQLLKNRIEVFLHDLEVENLKPYPYSGGFFVTILCKDGFAVAEELIKNDIFVLPLEEAIRVSVSSISMNEICGLAKTIRTAIDYLEIK